jgi:hypothetical protein
MPRNDIAAPGHVCPHIRIHIVDIIQPPGMGISPIADMDTAPAIVTAALTANSSAETPMNARLDARMSIERLAFSRVLLAHACCIVESPITTSWLWVVLD